MASRAAATRSERRFRRTGVVLAVLGLAFVVVLTPLFPLSVREQASGAGLLIGGLVAAVATFRRARIETGAAARPWRLLFAAAIIAIAGNLWVTASGSDPTTDPSLISIASIALALLLSIVALMIFPVARRRGAELVVTFLDGLVAGGAFLLIASVTAFSTLLDSTTNTTTADQVTGVAFPVLDVLLATVAVLLVVRAKATDRLMLVLVAGAYLLYAASDLAYAVRTNQGDFYFGTVLDLGWILGYLLIGLAAAAPMRGVAGETARIPASVADALGTTLVFTVLVIATVIQVLFGGSGSLEQAQSALWVVIVVAAGVRQLLLTADNNALRRGLERRVEEQTADLRRLARQNEVLVTSVGDGVYGVDHQGRVTFVNPSGAAVLGYRPEELQGKRAHELFHAPDAAGTPYPWPKCYVFEAITYGQTVAAEEDEYLRADGSTFPVEITASPLLDEDEIRGAVVVFRDVTQRREVDRMKDEFLSVVSHELRTPLTSIRGSLGLLAGGRLGELPDRAAQLISVASQSTDRLTRLINDLLDIERLESGTRPMELNALDARYLLSSAVHQIEGMCAQLGITVEVVAAEGRVLADEDRVLQTLLNLIGNALKFSDRGSTIRLDAHKEGGEVHFRVIDDGRGIPADKLETVFERFQQVDSSDTRQKGGTGLGLAISKGIVERHGGRIWIESEVGRGTTVHFTLPAAARLGGGDEAAGAASSAPAVVVCDEDAATVEGLSSVLREQGYRAIGVTDTERAVELVNSEGALAVVLGRAALGASGAAAAEVVATLRGEDTQNVPILVVSGSGPDAEPELARAADAWLIEPVSGERIVETLALVLQGHHREGVVLLVEDDEQLAQVIATLLADEGLRVVRSTSAAEAIERRQEQRPDVIVLDVRLPDGNGSDVVSAFHQRWPLAHTPIVVYSAAEVDPGRRAGLRLGTTVFLTKGQTTPEQLRDQVLALVPPTPTDPGATRQGKVDGVYSH